MPEIMLMKHAEMLKSCKMKEVWRIMKDEWRMMKDVRWMMKDDDFKLLKSFALGLTDKQTNRQTDICDCRVAFVTEKFCCFKWMK